MDNYLTCYQVAKEIGIKKRGKANEATTLTAWICRCQPIVIWYALEPSQHSAEHLEKLPKVEKRGNKYTVMRKRNNNEATSGFS